MLAVLLLVLFAAVAVGGVDDHVVCKLLLSLSLFLCVCVRLFDCLLLLLSFGVCCCYSVGDGVGADDHVVCKLLLLLLLWLLFLLQLLLCGVSLFVRVVAVC